MAKSSKSNEVQKSKEIAPMDNDEFLKLDYKSGSEKSAKAILSPNIKIPLNLIDNSIKPELVHSTEKKNSWEIVLPAGSSLVRVGQSLKRETTEFIKKNVSLKVNTEPFFPDWVDFNPHPKLSTSNINLEMLNRINGRLIQPHYGVFGTDDRQVYYPSGYPWHCVGRVFVWDDASKSDWKWSGSAVLIGDRTIITAGHVIPWKSNNWAMKFVPAYYDGDSLLGNGISSWVSDCNGYDLNNTVSAWDMAVCRLATPLGKSYGFFGAKTYSSSWQGGNYWTLAGYPGAVAGANRPSRIMWFPTVDNDNDGDATELEYLADQTAGNSGGPVFGFWKGFPYVIGTVSGGEIITQGNNVIEDSNIAAGGKAIVDLILWARSNWL